MVIDVITYNGEEDLFEIRYNILKDCVDEFIVVEFDKTFSGKEKPWYGEQIAKWDKVRYCKVTDYNKYIELAKSSPNTEYGKGAEHWIREFCQKESIKDYLTHLKDEDIVTIGDCDEIRFPLAPWLKDTIVDGPTKLALIVYSYYLNNKSDEEFYGPINGYYRDIKGECLNHLRQNAKKSDYYYGWHFTSMGGFEAVKKKLEDSYSKQTYAADEIIDYLEENIIKQKDFLGRSFAYTIDETDWPQYLKDNKEKYKHLCK